MWKNDECKAYQISTAAKEETIHYSYDIQQEVKSSRTTTVLSLFPSKELVTVKHKVNTKAVSILVTFRQFTKRATLFGQKGTLMPNYCYFTHILVLVTSFSQWCVKR
jgi:hypothetical protein